MNTEVSVLWGCLAYCRCGDDYKRNFPVALMDLMDNEEETDDLS